MSLTKSKRRIAIAVTDQSTFEGDVVRGVIGYLHQFRDWELVKHQGKPFARFDELELAKLDGLIAGFYEKRWEQRVRDAGLAAVNIAAIWSDSTLPYVGNDEQATGRLGAEYLLDRGFSHFAFLAQGDTHYSHLRHQAFEQRIEAASGRTCEVFKASSSKTEQDQGRIGRWLKQLPKPVAVMAADDFLGQMAINTAVGLGIAVPDEMAILGIDNDVWHVAMSNVPMTSIQLDFHRVGYEAVRVLDALMAGQDESKALLIPPVGVISRRSTDVTQSQDAVVAQALAYMQDHLKQRISVEDVLKEVGMSRKMLEIRMKRAIGRTPHAAMNHLRVQQAQRLLKQTRFTIDQIAQRCGFAQSSRFIEVFKRHVGMTPGAYRQDVQFLDPDGLVESVADLYKPG